MSNDHVTNTELTRIVKSLQDHLDRGLHEVRDELRRHREALYGNGGKGIRGQVIELTGKVERLEQCAERSWQMKLAAWGWAVALAIAVTQVISMLL